MYSSPTFTTMSDELGEELWTAAADGKKAKAQELLRRNADVNWAHRVSGAGLSCPIFTAGFGPQYDGTTPLHRAAACNHAAIVQLLLEHGADPDLKDMVSAASCC